jgi:hypothetical protein
VPAFDELKRRFEELVVTGSRVFASARPPGRGVVSDYYVDSALFHEWRAAGYSLVAFTFGDDSSHYRLLKEGCVHPYREHTARGLGVLKAARQDLDAGFLVGLKNLVAADFFADFLEMAEYLLKSRYKDPATVLIGGVLEEHIRALCRRATISISDGNGPLKADRLNAELAKAAVYTKLDQKAVTAWLDLRNKAAHGEYSAYTDEQVRLMLQGVRDFANRTLALRGA